MNNGKLIVGGILGIAALVGAAVYYFQVYAFYTAVSFTPGAEIRLTPIIGDAPEVIIADNVDGIDANSSPLRFRACFHTPLTQAMLTETYKVYDGATPLYGPSWFSCFDADAIGEALERGEALAFLSERDISPGVDRVVAVFPDGSAYAWHQTNAEMENQ